jgi:hypothetical protein
VTDHLEDHESLIEDFSNAANTIALSSSAGDIVNKVFSALRLYQETGE